MARSAVLQAPAHHGLISFEGPAPFARDRSAATSTSAAATGARAASPPSAPALLTADQQQTAFAVRLLQRVTFTGPTPEALAAVQAAGGPNAWLEQQLVAPAAADASLDAALALRFPLAHASAPYVWANTENGSWDAQLDLAQWTLCKNIWSSNQLFEVMCEFWSNHLNIQTPGGNAWATKPDNDANVIRAHAFGRFDDMLAASVVSPAMLEGLTNVDNSKVAPDENLGREIMELHSVGVNAGYGQEGVEQASRAFTGLSVYYPWNGGTADNVGTLFNNADDHYVGPLQVLGWSHPNATATGAVEVAQSLARYLANHPDTATRIATKLATRFVSDNPPASLITRLAAVYTANQTAIVPVLRALFQSLKFGGYAGQKYRRPIEDVAATTRAMGWTLDPAQPTATGAVGDLYWALTEMGQAPLAWPAPDGYPDVSGAWVGTGTVLARWNAHLVLTNGWLDTGLTRQPLAARLLPTPLPTTRTALVTALFMRLLPTQPVSSAQVTALVTYLGGPGPVQNGDVTWNLGYLVALVLDAPQWNAR